jgi:peptide/nickel transport system ATP-binding protein
MVEPVLTIDRLSVRADDAGMAGGARPLLIDDVSLAVAPGEVLGLVGESGAGKSTLALTAMGYVRPGCHVSAGSVRFGGADMLAMDEARLRQIRGARIAYIAQSPAASFNPARRLAHQVAETLVLHRGLSWNEGQERAVELFAELDLPSPETFGRRFPHQVSGGQLQRAMIAMAIACEPELLILDEPTTALDVTTQIEVLVAIRKTLRRHRTAALYITHDLAVVAQMAHRIVVLRHGRTVETGPTRDIIVAPRDNYTRRLFAAESMPGAARDPAPAPAGAIPAALDVRRVTTSYRDARTVLRDISLTVQPGKTLAIVGASGSGKTTLARVICGLMPPGAGEVRFRGEVLAASFRKRKRDQLRRIQFVYQHPDTAINPQQRIGKLLGRVVKLHDGGSRHGIAARVAQLLHEVGLPPEHARRRAWQLSGGEKQRIGIARALAARPDVVICDEITSSLDPLVADGILDLLKQIQGRTGAAYIVITHDIGVVRRIADTVAVLHDGALAALGTLADVFSPPLHPSTERLLACVPQMRTDWLSELLDQRAACADARPSITSPHSHPLQPEPCQP